MYRNTTHALTYAYQVLAEYIIAQSPLYDSERIAGAAGCLTPAEKHAEAVLIIRAAEAVLNDAELAAVELKYTGGIKADNLPDLTRYAAGQFKHPPDMLLLDDLILSLYRDKPAYGVLTEKHGIGQSRCFRLLKRVRQTVAGLEYTAGLKLDDELRRRQIIL